MNALAVFEVIAGGALTGAVVYYFAYGWTWLVCVIGERLHRG